MTRWLLAGAAAAAALTLGALAGVLFGVGVAYRLLAPHDPLNVNPPPRSREDPL